AVEGEGREPGGEAQRSDEDEEPDDAERQKQEAHRQREEPSRKQRAGEIGGASHESPAQQEPGAQKEHLRQDESVGEHLGGTEDRAVEEIALMAEEHPVADE